MKQLLLFIILATVSCKEQDTKPKYEADFTDRAINLAIQNPGNIVELPGLYPYEASIIPLEKDEQWQLANKLITRGFKERQRSAKDFSLNGQRLVTIVLSDTICECKITKVYRTTPYTSRYEVSERISCLNKN